VAAPELVAVPLVGSTTPRLHTQPLVTGRPGPCGCGCPLTPETSYGFAVVEFARDVVGFEIDPWQRWLLLHAGELLPDGRPRFRKVIVQVGRQNGKTTLVAVLALWWLFVECPETILGTSTKLEYAQDAWEKSVKLALASPALKALLPEKAPHGVRRTNGSVGIKTLDDSEYRIAPANEEGGRSKTVALAILDELRQHFDYSAWNAIIPATNAVRFAQAWALTNAGSDRSVVLNDQRKIGLAGSDERLGLFEWSAPEGADPEDAEALCMANPSVGIRQELDVLLSDARAAKEAGGAMLAGFKTEVMCIRVKNLDPAIDPDSWLACLETGDLSTVRSRIALCLDVSIDAQHATLCAAAVLPDGRVRVEPVEAWSGPGCTIELARALPGLVAKIKPRVVGWFPTGPAASLSVDLAKRREWPPRGVKVDPIRGESADVCMAFAEAVRARTVVHSADPLLDTHVSVAEPIRSGDRWVFGRRGVGHVDAAYAAAGAVHLARSLPVAAAAGRVVSVPLD
jgi:hypothetical protein